MGSNPIAASIQHSIAVATRTWQRQGQPLASELVGAAIPPLSGALAMELAAPTVYGVSVAAPLEAQDPNHPPVNL